MPCIAIWYRCVNCAAAHAFVVASGYRTGEIGDDTCFRSRLTTELMPVACKRPRTKGGEGRQHT